MKALVAFAILGFVLWYIYTNYIQQNIEPDKVRTQEIEKVLKIEK
jgi:hypothetical protein